MLCCKYACYLTHLRLILLHHSFYLQVCLHLVMVWLGQCLVLSLIVAGNFSHPVPRYVFVVTINCIQVKLHHLDLAPVLKVLSPSFRIILDGQTKNWTCSSNRWLCRIMFSQVHNLETRVEK